MVLLTLIFAFHAFQTSTVCCTGQLDCQGPCSQETGQQGDGYVYTPASLEGPQIFSGVTCHIQSRLPNFKVVPVAVEADTLGLNHPTRASSAENLNHWLTSFPHLGS